MACGFACAVGERRKTSARGVGRVVADGGADRLYRGVAEGLARREGRPVAAVRDQLLPDLVVGDLDSISSEARDFYRSRGIEGEWRHWAAECRESALLCFVPGEQWRKRGVIAVRDLSGDEDTTDLVKCLRAVEQAAGTRGPLPTVLVLGAFGGRFDHTLANVAALHTFSHMDIVLVGDGNIARCVLLRMGHGPSRAAGVSAPCRFTQAPSARTNGGPRGAVL